MVFDVAHSCLARTIGAAEESVLSFDAVPDNPARAVFASGSEFVDRTLEAVKRMARTSSNYLEGQVIIVAAYFTFRHPNSPCFGQQLLWQAGYFPGVRLNPRRECFGRLSCIPKRVSLKRLQRLRLVKVNDGIELNRQARIEVVALPFGLRQIDDADCPL